jgi:outer membrane receptor for monomeric catechols
MPRWVAAWDTDLQRDLVPPRSGGRPELRPQACGIDQCRAGHQATLQYGRTARWSAALFQTSTDNEIVVASNDNGRTSYQNAGKTRRRGMG